jgi:hypothetical protein
MKLYTITNSFHESETRKKYDDIEREDITCLHMQGLASPAQVKAQHRAWKKLCGWKDCCCCNEWGER